MADKVTLSIRRQDTPGGPSRWERFEIERDDAMTIAYALAGLETPIAWDDTCEWPACGVCTMVINGRARPACATTVGQVDPKQKGTITLAPLAGFEVIRDLWVDRARMADDAARVLAPSEGAKRPAPLAFARCTRCGACVDACPEAYDGRAFVGPAAFAERHAERQRHAPPPDAVRHAVRVEGGIGDCGHAEACIDACPEAIPLDEALSTAARDAAPDWLRKLVGG